MIILEITRNNLFKYKMSERHKQKPLRISCQSDFNPRKISGTFYAKSRENTWNLMKTTRKLKAN